MKKVKILAGYLLLAAALVTVLFPMVLLLFGSFLDSESVSIIADHVHLDPEQIHFSMDQYLSVLAASPDYLMRFWNSCWLVIPAVVGQSLFAVMTSYGLARGKGKVFSGLLFLYLVLMLLPSQVTVVPNYYAAKRLGILGTDLSVWLPGIFSPFSVYLLTSFMKRIPEEIYEAAKVDGAGEIRVFFRICMPLSKGPIMAMALLMLVDCWNQVELPLMMFSNAARYPLSVFLSVIREESLGISFAASVVYVIPVFLAAVAFMDDLKEGISQSGVKS